MPGEAGGSAGDAAGRQSWHARLNLEPLKDWITLGEAEEILGISRQAVHRLVERGTLNARTIGRKPYIVVHVKSVAALPMTPQRRRELAKRASVPEDLDAGLGATAPEG